AAGAETLGDTERKLLGVGRLERATTDDRGATRDEDVAQGDLGPRAGAAQAVEPVEDLLDDLVLGEERAGARVEAGPLVPVADLARVATLRGGVGLGVGDRRHVLGGAEVDHPVAVALRVPGGGQARAHPAVLGDAPALRVLAVVLVV